MKGPALRLVLPVVVIVEVFLVWSGVMDLGEAAIVIIGVEVLILALAGGSLLLATRRYRSQRGFGLGRWAALEEALSWIMPRKAARLVLHEPKLFAALIRWIFRRVKPGPKDFGYHKRSTLRVLLPLVFVAAPAELAVLHLLLYIFSPWAWLHWALFALEMYGIFWLLGFYASLVTLPHRLEEEGLRFRYGAFAEGFVPYREISEILLKELTPPKSRDGLHYVPEDDALYLAVGGKTHITLRLHNPRSAHGFFNDSPPAYALHLAADEPDKLLKTLRDRLPASALNAPR